MPDNDADGDGTYDCDDGCPDNPDLIDPNPITGCKVTTLTEVEKIEKEKEDLIIREIEACNRRPGYHWDAGHNRCKHDDVTSGEGSASGATADSTYDADRQYRIWYLVENNQKSYTNSSVCGQWRRWKFAKGAEVPALIAQKRRDDVRALQERPELLVYRGKGIQVIALPVGEPSPKTIQCKQRKR